MTPTLWPSLAHLPEMLLVFAVAALTVGLGALTGARRLEIAFIAGWGLAGLVTVVIGTLTPFSLSPVMLILGALGLCGLLLVGVTAATGTPVLRCGIGLRVLLLGLPLFVGIEGMVASGWDDFSHWLLNLDYLCRYGHFPTLALPSPSGHAAYPYALALPGYAVFLLSGAVAERAALVWNMLAMLAACACMASLLEVRLPAGRWVGWAAAAAGVLFGGLACPTFVPKIALSNMADSASGSALAVLVAVIFDWWRAPDGRSRWREVTAAAMCALTLVNLRQSNFALFLLLLIGLGLIAILCRPRPAGGLRALAVALPLPLLAWALWHRYANAEIPGGEFVIMPFASWHWAEFGEALLSILRVMLAKIGLFGLILVITVRAGFALRRRDTLLPAERAVLLLGVVLCVGNVGFLAFTYLAADFGADEAAAAASFWRYTSQTGPLAVLALFAALPVPWLAVLGRRGVAWAGVAIAVLLPIVAIKTYRHDLASPVPELRRIALAVNARLPVGAPVELVDLTGPGFGPEVVAYQLWLSGWHGPDRAVAQVWTAHGYSLAEARKLPFPPAGYLWLVEGAPEMQALFGPPLQAGCAYLLKAEAGRFAIDAAWPVSRFTRPVNRDGWSVQRGAACR
jgi:hypothetical protein